MKCLTEVHGESAVMRKAERRRVFKAVDHRLTLMISKPPNSSSLRYSWGYVDLL